jgi:hypothetical protein
MLGTHRCVEGPAREGVRATGVGGGQVGDRLAGSVGRASRRVSARLAASKEWRVAAMAGRVQVSRSLT